MLRPREEDRRRTNPDDEPDPERELRARLERHRLTYREFTKVLIAVGASVKTSAKGSGHFIVRYGEHSGAIRSKDRKETEKWQPESVMSTIKKLRIPMREFLAVIMGEDGKPG